MTGTIRMWKSKVIRGDPRVSLVVASYLVDDKRRVDSLMCLLYSLKAQTYPNWQAIVVHDGPMPRPVWDLVCQCDPVRICVVETSERKGQFGHPWRRWGIDRSTGQYVGLSNDDNYYAPVYFEAMLAAIQENEAQLAYCDLVHSHRHWDVIRSKPARGFVDAGNWIVSADLAKATPWTDMGFAGDWTYFQELHRKAKRVVKVPGVFFVHN